MGAAKKTSLAIPEDLLEQVELAAQKRGVSRNKFVLGVLRRAVQARRDAEITSQLDALFADKDTALAQKHEALVWEEQVNADWSDEIW